MNDQEFGNMVEQYERLVYTICYQFTKDHHTAQDLSQDAFIAAYRHKDDCPKDNLKPWLARIATNKAKDHLKSAYNRRVQATEDEKIPEQKGHLFAKAPLPEDLAVGREQLEKIKSEVETLKEPYLKVSVMFFLEDKSVEEIAEALRRPPKTVHTQLYRAKRILQDKLKGGGIYGAV